jgi:enoyl-CoA hydratase/carnithine racemase
MTDATGAGARIEDHGSWVELILDRPERKNAITGIMGRSLATALEELAASKEIQVVLLRGAGGAFCSGLDLTEFNAQPPPEWLPEFQQIWRAVHRGLFNLPQPIVGALERYAINGGAALALACDLLVAGDGAFLQVGEVQLGMAAPYNMAWLAMRHPERTAAELALPGARHAGQELVSMGVATRSVEDSLVLETARETCRTLAGYPAGAGTRIKAGIRARLNEEADRWFDRFTATQTGSPRPPERRTPPTTG